MTRSARRRGSSSARRQRSGGRRSGPVSEAKRTALPRLTGYLDAVADALNDAGLTVLEVNAHTDATGLHGAICVATPPLASGSPDGAPDHDTQHEPPRSVSLVWRQRSGWSLHDTAREPGDGRAPRYLHPDLVPDPESLARVVRALLAGRLVATPVGPPGPPAEDNPPNLLDALTYRAGRRP